MKYQLIQTYPGSPEIGTLVTYNADTDLFISEDNYGINPKSIHNYPNFWKPIYDKITINDIKHLVKIETFRSGGTGGQHTNAGESGIRLTCEDFKFEISLSYFRSALQNRDICLSALQLVLDQVPLVTQDYYSNLKPSET